MDGILSAINSVIPLVPENSLITDRGNVKNPPVEVAPVPDNSFKSDDVLAKTLKRAYTLDLDIRGYEEKAAYKSQAGNASKTTVPNQPADTEQQQESLLSEAFTLSLGSREELQLNSESMRELLRLKNYEMLGKKGGRRTTGRNPEKLSGEEKGPQETEAPEIRGRAGAGGRGNMVSKQLTRQEAELLARVLSQAEEAPQPVHAGPEHEGSNRTAPRPDNSDELLQNMQRGLHPEEELQPRSSVPYTPPEEAGARTQGLIDSEKLQQFTANNPLPAGTGTGEMPGPVSSNAAFSVPDGLQTEKPVIAPSEITEQEFNLLLFDKNIQNNIESPFNLSDSTAGGVKNSGFSTFGEPPGEQLGNLRAAALSDPKLSRITGELFTEAKPSGNLQSAAGGSMANLRKITELPYALYIFGRADEKVRGGVQDEEEDPVIQEDGIKKRDHTQYDLLRVSEAIRMASVLHDIYYGGSGRFADELPWYWPYVSYALRYGIIQVDDFTDFNSFATKAETAYIFSRSVPDAELIVFNHIPYLPDVAEDSSWGERIYLLFRAGVLTGADDSGRFYPDRLMTRTEAAAIIGRIATPEDRKGFTL